MWAHPGAPLHKQACKGQGCLRQCHRRRHFWQGDGARLARPVRGGPCSRHALRTRLLINCSGTPAVLVGIQSLNLPGCRPVTCLPVRTEKGDARAALGSSSAHTPPAASILHWCPHAPHPDGTLKAVVRGCLVGRFNYTLGSLLVLPGPVARRPRQGYGPRDPFSLPTAPFPQLKCCKVGVLGPDRPPAPLDLP